MRSDDKNALSALEADENFQAVKRAMHSTIRDSAATRILKELDWHYDDTFQRWIKPVTSEIFDKEKIEESGIDVNIHDQIEWLIDFMVSSTNSNRSLRNFIDKNETIQKQLKKMGEEFCRDQVSGITTQIVAALERLLDDREDVVEVNGRRTVYNVCKRLSPELIIEIHKTEDKFEYKGPVKYLNLALQEDIVKHIIFTEDQILIYIE